MSQGTCNKPDCERPVRFVTGLCFRHGKDLVPRRPIYPTVCTLDECDRKFYAREFCKTHYVHWLESGDPGGPIQPLGTNVGSCSVTECDRQATVRGYCHPHYQHWRAGVTPSGALIDPHTRTEHPNYFLLHQHLSTDLGRAANYLCVDCGDAAAEWSYDHADPDEITDPQYLLVYSLSSEHYSPRCKPCHRKFDHARRSE